MDTRVRWRVLAILGAVFFGFVVFHSLLQGRRSRSWNETSDTKSRGRGKDTDIFHMPDIPMDDPRVIAAIRKMLVPPTLSPYNFSKPIPAGKDASAGQLKVIQDILQGFGEDSFYLDCGAMDGELVSNTLFLEKSWGWRGLLVEANPKEFQVLSSKHRNAWSGNFCLSNTKYPQILPFYTSPLSYGMSSLIVFRPDVQDLKNVIQVPCFPLYSVLFAVNRTTVEFFSFDVEGSEMNILRTLPFDKVIFKVLVIEHIIIKEGKKGLREFMEGQGYIFFGEVHHASAQDSVFIHKSVQLTEDQEKRKGKIHNV